MKKMSEEQKEYMRQEVDTISIEDLEAAARADIILEQEGYEGWLRRQQEAIEWLSSRPGLRENILKSVSGGLNDY